MAGTRISQFPNLPSGSLASEDVLLVVDISDSFYSPSGTNKSTTVGDLSNFFTSANNFVGLADTPGSLGAAAQAVVVAADGNSLVFSGISAGGIGAPTTFVGLTDTADSLGSEGQVAVVSGSDIVFSGLSKYASVTQSYEYLNSLNIINYSSLPNYVSSTNSFICRFISSSIIS